MMRQGWIVFAVLMFVTATAEAGKIYGSLQVNGKAVAAGTQVKIKCGGKSYTTKVQNHGRYSVNVDKEGPCSFSVAGYAGATTEVVSYNEATRYNFLLAGSGNGYSMKRK